jgi:hypothetical protein
VFSIDCSRLLRFYLTLSLLLFFEIRTVYQKQQSTMKSSSILSFLAFILLSFFVAPSYSQTMGKGKGKGKGGNRPPPSPPPPSPPTVDPCEASCQRIVKKPHLDPCDFNGCIGRFECQNLALNGVSVEFKNQQECKFFCAEFTNVGCPSNNAFASCLQARCK